MSRKIRLASPIYRHIKKKEIVGVGYLHLCACSILYYNSNGSLPLSWWRTETCVIETWMLWPDSYTDRQQRMQEFETTPSYISCMRKKGKQIQLMKLPVPRRPIMTSDSGAAPSLSVLGCKSIKTSPITVD